MLRDAFTPPCGFATATVATAPGLSAIMFWGYRLIVHPDGSCFLHKTYYDGREGSRGSRRGRAATTRRTSVRRSSRTSEGLAEASLRFLNVAVDDAPVTVN